MKTFALLFISALALVSATASAEPGGREGAKSSATGTSVTMPEDTVTASSGAVPAPQLATDEAQTAPAAAEVDQVARLRAERALRLHRTTEHAFLGTNHVPTTAAATRLPQTSHHDKSTQARRRG